MSNYYKLINKPLLIVISGPSGVGKDSVIAELCKKNKDYHQIITVTTRPKRKGEIENKDYNFVLKDEFDSLIKNKKLLEWAEVYGSYYGVPNDSVKEALKKYKVVIIKVDVQGAETIKKIIPEAILIFLLPVSENDLFQRLTKRGDISHADLKRRLQSVNQELKKLYIFDYVVENYTDDLKLTTSKIKYIIESESCRVKNRIIKLNK